MDSFTIRLYVKMCILLFQEKGALDTFTHGPLALKYKLDNEFELLFVVVLFSLSTQ